LLVTGAPGVGKTTVLIKTVNSLKYNGISVGGMVSQEVRKGGVRVGFEIVDLSDEKRGWLSHVNQANGPQVGKYRVNMADLEEIGAKAVLKAVDKCRVVAIDEIGPMELFSQAFKQSVQIAFGSGKPMLVVVHAKAKDHLIREAKQREDSETFTVTSANREFLPETLRKQIVSLL